MEVIVGRSNKIVYYGEPGWGANASYSIGGNTPVSTSVTSNNGQYSINLPFLIRESDITVTWNFTIPGLGAVTDVQEIEAVTPLIPIAEVKAFLETTSDKEALQAEASVRYIINSHCGQTFGNYTGIKKAVGQGSSSLTLPARLMSLVDVNGDTHTTNYNITNDGFKLEFFPWGPPPVKADAYGYHMHVGGVIHNPNNVKVENWGRGATFEINGDWGYKNVPGPVGEAARLLLNDYTCADSQYRDRYLVSMTAADWRIQFYTGAYRRTGNVRADQLLSPFVLKHGWVAI